MFRSQLLVLAGFVLALVIDCNSQPPGPSLADQLDAARELAEFEDEQYQKAVANRHEPQGLALRSGAGRGGRGEGGAALGEAQPARCGSPPATRCSTVES